VVNRPEEKLTAELPALAAAVVLFSALLHATWNLLLSKVPRGLDTTAVALVIGLVAWTPIALARWRVEPAVWPYVLTSGALELIYFAALTLAYSKAPAHAVYPVARGLAPTLLLPVVALGGGRIAPIAGIGVLAVTCGVLLTARGETDRRSVLYAVPVALCIAGYTYVDALGLRHADPAPYLWLTMVITATALVAARVVRGRGVGPLRAQLRLSTFVLGVGVYAAYGLTLVALSIVSVAQAPAVAALRETSILFLLGLSWLAGRRASGGDPELAVPARPTASTAAGAVLVLGGVAVLAFV
jgi:uncharacterized membrane protein